jgi:xylulokinase
MEYGDASGTGLMDVRTMCAIGTGNIRVGVVTVSLGTSGTVCAFSEEPVIDPKGEVAAFCDATDHWLPLTCTMNLAVATEQMRALFGWDIALMEEHVAAIPAARAA